jgi:hypothetical protein
VPRLNLNLDVTNSMRADNAHVLHSAATNSHCCRANGKVPERNVWDT